MNSSNDSDANNFNNVGNNNNNNPLDNVKRTIREFNPNHIILHVGTNELKSSKVASQISSSVIDLALSLKSETNNVMILLIIQRKDSLNNKAQEVKMCGERDITFF